MLHHEELIDLRIQADFLPELERILAKEQIPIIEHQLAKRNLSEYYKG